MLLKERNLVSINTKTETQSDEIVPCWHNDIVITRPAITAKGQTQDTKKRNKIKKIVQRKKLKIIKQTCDSRSNQRESCNTRCSLSAGNEGRTPTVLKKKVRLTLAGNNDHPPHTSLVKKEMETATQTSSSDEQGVQEIMNPTRFSGDEIKTETLQPKLLDRATSPGLGGQRLVNKSGSNYDEQQRQQWKTAHVESSRPSRDAPGQVRRCSECSATAELVIGQTLRRWLDGSPGSVDQAKHKSDSYLLHMLDKKRGILGNLYDYVNFQDSER